MASKKTNKKNPATPETAKGPYKVLIPAGLFIGMGLGFATGNVPAGIFLGLGFGFLLGFYYSRKK